MFPHPGLNTSSEWFRLADGIPAPGRRSGHQAWNTRCWRRIPEMHPGQQAWNSQCWCRKPGKPSGQQAWNTHCWCRTSKHIQASKHEIHTAGAGNLRRIQGGRHGIHAASAASCIEGTNQSDVPQSGLTQFQLEMHPKQSLQIRDIDSVRICWAQRSKQLLQEDVSIVP